MLTSTAVAIACNSTNFCLGVLCFNNACKLICALTSIWIGAIKQGIIRLSSRRGLEACWSSNQKLQSLQIVGRFQTWILKVDYQKIPSWHLPVESSGNGLFNDVGPIFIALGIPVRRALEIGYPKWKNPVAIWDSFTAAKMTPYHVQKIDRCGRQAYYFIKQTRQCKR